MASSAHGEPSAGQEMDLSHEAPSPAQQQAPLERTELERLEFEGTAGDFGGRISMWVKGGLLPTAELFTLCFATCGTTALAWAICHYEHIDKWVTLLVTAVVAGTTFVTGRRYLAKHTSAPHR